MKKLLLALSCIKLMFSQTFTLMVIPIQDKTKYKNLTPVLTGKQISQVY